MKKRWVSIALLGVFLYWIWPEIFSVQVSPQTTPAQLVVDRLFLGFKTGETTYPREKLDYIAVRYKRAYFDTRMRGLHRVGIQMRDGSFLILKQHMTTLNYEPSLALGPDVEINRRQAMDDARAWGVKLRLEVRDETAR